jgi:hypothetical protein
MDTQAGMENERLLAIILSNIGDGRVVFAFRPGHTPSERMEPSRVQLAKETNISELAKMGFNVIAAYKTIPITSKNVQDPV